MKHRNQTPPLTARAKSARRRDRIASIALFAVIVAAAVLTGFIWFFRSAAQ